MFTICSRRIGQIQNGASQSRISFGFYSKKKQLAKKSLTEFGEVEEDEQSANITTKNSKDQVTLNANSKGRFTVGVRNPRGNGGARGNN